MSRTLKLCIARPPPKARRSADAAGMARVEYIADLRASIAERDSERAEAMRLSTSLRRVEEDVRRDRRGRAAEAICILFS